MHITVPPLAADATPDSVATAIPPASTVRGWASRTPPEFTFTCKLPQEITHERRFVDAADILHAFTDRMRELGPRLGPILIQCGPDFSPSEIDAFAAFLPALPTDLLSEPSLLVGAGLSVVTGRGAGCLIVPLGLARR